MFLMGGVSFMTTGFDVKLAPSLVTTDNVYVSPTFGINPDPAIYNPGSDSSNTCNCPFELLNITVAPGTLIFCLELIG
jgi:hypothetical protein